MSQNVGTLITSAIRPNDSLDPIASAYATEIKGGVHVATSSTVRDAIIVERREWGMLCYVINDLKTYQLVYNNVDTVITNNANWAVFSSGSGATSSSSGLIEYQYNTPSVTSGNGSPTGITITYTPMDNTRIQVFVNGQLQRLGDGVSTNDCYFSPDGIIFRTFSAIISGDELYWNGVISGFDLDVSDSIGLVYEY